MKNIILIAGLAFALGLLGWWFVSVTDKTDSTDSESIVETSTKASVLVASQSNPEEVVIQKATLTEPGFVAVRAVENGRLGQIVEISDYLTAGTHTDVPISLGDFYEGDKELIVMVYEDAGNDKIFNDLDQPFEEGGIPVAVYVANGQSVPKSIVTNTGSPEGISLMGMGTMEFISYTDSGFEPKDLSISLGTMAHFVNESSVDMWVASDDHPAHTDLPTFDQFKGSKPGEQYVYIFDQVGEWKYHDHLSPTAVGTITVTN
jgi:plastocyanin